MQVKEVLANVEYELIQGDVETTIEAISYHSKHIKQDSLFICVKGARTDGHDYIAQAIMKGASAIVIERKVALAFIPPNFPVILVKDTRAILSAVAIEFYQHPSKNFRLVGVTGTNGKTSVTHMISSILQSTNRKVGSIGTLGNKINEVDVETRRSTPTTPEAFDLQHAFAKMKQSAVSDVVMEVTSIGLARKRVQGSQFDIAIFLNLSPHHIEEHGSFEQYKNAKLLLFQSTPFSIINMDDPYGEEVMDACTGKYVTISTQNERADFYAIPHALTADCVSFTFHHKEMQEEFSIPIPGSFTVYNALAAIACCLQLGLSLPEIQAGLQQVQSPIGRLQTIQAEEGFSVMIDYAHTPIALENVLSNIRAYTKGKLLIVFGCEGEIRYENRRKMGAVVSRWCDHIILTADNPRNEPLDQITNEIKRGLSINASYEIIEEREQAIKRSILLAEQGDIVLIAGKGHETHQIIGDEHFPFHDQQIVEEYVNRTY
ncbi:UDP-N-acetylmuramoyl-L-alanyl-D-glutamate--2,6-diaminopimelate ligase [Pontibacillus litoralis]|uniref:UDP-N-acetylmuramoyl-L-alanyl-D-glutamate--2,6-diaminopimelate ligase n=1 Tax=Pontibacillus litoralis JSM 072002 TaxID=1385512 RepID=A0A0A5G8P2_9BACI|nr:UDP-N-acetylmuramoyl-L-alanyl-D-glutamate--2,6-diaminopimelate ligase [Pontibacillus litoralis]KGX87528.1 hypothetical protein N784_14880 [Pontibacillus litoralis JSM 072002]